MSRRAKGIKPRTSFYYCISVSVHCIFNTDFLGNCKFSYNSYCFLTGNAYNIGEINMKVLLQKQSQINWDHEPCSFLVSHGPTRLCMFSFIDTVIINRL